MLLKDKITRFLGIDENKLGTGCYPSANAINLSYDEKAEVFWVGDVGEHFGMGYAMVGHFYVIPPGAEDTDMALNHEDAGYGEYPALTVCEVRMLGEPFE